jgi:osmotically-inducible protein OsmY
MGEKTMMKMAPDDISIDDETLARRVYRALDGVEPLRVLGSPVYVRVCDSTVALSGVVATYPIKAQALEAVRNVRGVRHVQDQLCTDSELEIRIAHALSVHSSTRNGALGIIVSAANGFVSLVGRVPNSEIAQTAEEVAAGVSGVRAVANRLRVEP